ncbi:hypothetical protein ACJ2A9_15400 [Anaerobacillus sp. MEB173]|uniref:hypothetical protein n=1 Tax=Anaerobacillus sp. MEB173 TaxID=3383345 RepID=UPI003F925ECD
MKKAILTCGLALSLLAACSPANPPQALQVPNDRPEAGTMERMNYHFFGPGPINYGVIYDNHRGDYLQDGHINHSPSFKTLDNTRPDLGDDEQMIRLVVANEKGIRPGLVAIIGKDAWVNVHFTDSYPKNEREKKLNALKKSLNDAIPRYDVHLNVNEGGQQKQ